MSRLSITRYLGRLGSLPSITRTSDSGLRELCGLRGSARLSCTRPRRAEARHLKRRLHHCNYCFSCSPVHKITSAEALTVISLFLCLLHTDPDGHWPNGQLTPSAQSLRSLRLRAIFNPSLSEGLIFFCSV